MEIKKWMFQSFHGHVAMPAVVLILFVLYVDSPSLPFIIESRN